VTLPTDGTRQRAGYSARQSDRSADLTSGHADERAAHKRIIRINDDAKACMTCMRNRQAAELGAVKPPARARAPGCSPEAWPPWADAVRRGLLMARYQSRPAADVRADR